jgi:hypothetical protein
MSRSPLHAARRPEKHLGDFDAADALMHLVVVAHLAAGLYGCADDGRGPRLTKKGSEASLSVSEG